jgi:hypothetical protein
MLPQSPYPGRQNPLMPHKRLRYSRNVMRNTLRDEFDDLKKDLILLDQLLK